MDPTIPDPTTADLAWRDADQRRFCDLVPTGIFQTNAAGTVVYANPRWTQMSGLGAGATLTQVLEFIDPTDRAALLIARQAAIKDGHEWSHEIRIRWPDGRLEWQLFRARPLLAPDGTFDGNICFAEDTTARHKLEDQLRVKSAALEAAANAVAIVDRQGVIEWVNPAFTGLTQYTSAEVVGHSPRVLKSGRHPPEFYADLWRTVTAGRVWRGELLNRRKDGSLYMEDMTITPVRNESGEVIRFIALKQDTTERTRAAEAVREARDAALESARLKSEFLANMSHEIRTPMNGVIGMLNLLEDAQLTPQQRDFAQTARTSAEALLNVLNDILDFSKIEAGKLAIDIIDFDLREVVEGALELLADRAQSKGLELIGDIADDIPRAVRGDSNRLRQVLLNLIGNAIKFTARGEVVISVRIEPDRAKDPLLRFEIRDTGIGISPEAMPRLFQAFAQADGSTTRQYGGTGLGLVISRRLVELMGGILGANSEPGRGSAFWFNLTLPPAEKMLPVPRPIDVAGHRVLVVDDNATNRLVLKHQLAGWRMRQAEATGGVEALAMLHAAQAAHEPFAIALLDLQMPGMDGLGLARAIKADPVIAAIRLVILTSQGAHLSQDTLRESGIRECLLKPVRQSRLREAIARTLGEREQRAPAPAVDPVASATRTDRKANPLRLLLAEDNAVNQRVALGQLKRLGYAAIVVGNGREAVAAQQRDHFEAILMDCQMPEMEGYEASRLIRARESAQIGKPGATAYIIAMTAHALEGDREKCLAAGMNDYLSKPVKLGDLQAALARASSFHASGPGR